MTFIPTIGRLATLYGAQVASFAVLGMGLMVTIGALVIILFCDMD